MTLVITTLAVLFPTLALAAECDLVRGDPMVMSGENLTITFERNKRVVIVSTVSVPAEVVERATELLLLNSRPTANDILKMRFLLEENRLLLAELGSNRLFLREALFSASTRQIFLDLSSQQIAELEVFARRFDLNSPPRTSQIVIEREDLEKLLLLTVGPVMLLKIEDPQAFRNVAFLEMNRLFSLGLRESQRPVASRPTTAALRARAAQKYKEALESLESSQRSRAQLVSLSRQIRSRTYARLSDTELKAQILRQFWRPARGAVGAWVDAELALRRSLRGPSARQPAANPTATQLIGDGLALVSANSFARLEEHFRKECR